jgi:cell division protein FtsL
MMPFAQAQVRYAQPAERLTAMRPQSTATRLKVHKAPVKLIVGLLGLIALNAVLQSLVIQLDFEANQWQEKIRLQEREMLKSRMEIARLASLDRIQEVAVGQLGMRPAGVNDYLCIAVAPAQPPKSYEQSQPKRIISGDLWAEVNSWLGGLKAAIAKPSQTP